MSTSTRCAWKCTEDAVLRGHYPTEGAAYCAGLLPGRTMAAVASRAWKIRAVRSRDTAPIKATPWIDDAIRRAYGGDRKYGYVKRCAERLGLPATWVATRASDLGLIAPKPTAPWSDAERAFLEANPMRPPSQLAKLMRRRGWRRTASAIAMQRKYGIVARDDPAFFSATGLATAMCVDVGTVTTWIRSGLLIANRRGWARTETQRGDGYIIHENDVFRFVVNHPGHVSLAKIEPNKAWFIDMMARCAVTTNPKAPDKGQRIVAVARSNPGLDRTAIAGLTDSTPGAVSAVLSQARRHERPSPHA